MQLRKESLKKSGLPGFEPWPLRYRCSTLTNWTNKPTESWSLNWFEIYPGKMKMKSWIYETHIFELRNEEKISVKKILAVINATYAVAKRPALSWLVSSLVRALHRYRRGQGSNPGKPDFFRLSFRNCISCVNNCEDLLYTYFFFIPQFKYMSFIYSWFHLHLSRVYYEPI